MEDCRSILEELSARLGCAHVLVNPDLTVRGAGGNIVGFHDQDAEALHGRPIVEVFPAFSNYAAKFTELFDLPKSELRLRIRQGENRFVLVSVRRAALEPPALLVVLEDISTVVLRTEILGRRVRELESRCQHLERFLRKTGVPAEELKPHLDPETGLYDLDYMIGRLVEEEAFSRRWNRPFSVIVFRLRRAAASDVGTEAWMRRIAAAVRLNLRSADTVGRLDAGSLIALLPQTPKAGATASVERVLGVVRLEGLEAEGLGVGVAELELGRDDTALKMFERAKQAALGEAAN